jgi:hydrogenase maturation protease
MRRGGQGGEVLRALVIGLGNPLRGDDGLGPAVLDLLRRKSEAGWTLIESAGDDLLEWMAASEFDRIIVVDAADLGTAPGSWARLTPESLATPNELSHGFDLAQSLALLTALGIKPAPISIYAVQPAVVGWRPGLSRIVAIALAAVANAIRQELCRNQPSRRPPALAKHPEGAQAGAPWAPGRGRARTVLRTQQDVRSLPSGAETDY